VTLLIVFCFSLSGLSQYDSGSPISGHQSVTVIVFSCKDVDVPSSVSFCWGMNKMMTFLSLSEYQVANFCFDIEEYKGRINED